MQWASRQTSHRHGQERVAVLTTAPTLLSFRFFTLLFCLVACLLLAPAAHANPKYAAIVIDADTGTVLHEAHADATRHPASLTKMMTLYMTFEALDQGKLRMSQQLRASARAAGMPQTNISLREGDRISVKDAIVALVVRSANDAAVVLAEALGGTEYQFAVKMTQRGRQLGLKKTRFLNASGWPNKQQITTARDMATLGLRLREDFPHYYHFFNETKFRYNGRTYTGHNRVMEDTPGVDGIKTGYINMSGFNLVSSIKRDGYSLVAVVLGGRTSRSRDDHMRDLLRRSMRQIAQMRPPIGETRFAKGSAPVPVFKPGTEQATIAQTAATAEDVSLSFAAANEHMETAGRSKRAIGQEWGIQVGAFTESRDAFMAAINAMNIAANELEGSEINVVDPNGQSNRIYRARIANMTEVQARRACKKLIQHRENCFVYRDQQG